MTPFQTTSSSPDSIEHNPSGSCRLTFVILLTTLREVPDEVRTFDPHLYFSLFALVF
jgi:hypothetical protein